MCETHHSGGKFGRGSTLIKRERKCLEVSCTRTEVSWFFQHDITLIARKHSHEQKSARRIVGCAPPTIVFLIFSVFFFFERQELLELTSDYSVLDFCSCECVHVSVFTCSALDTLDAEKCRFSMLSQFNVVLKKNDHATCSPFGPHEISLLIHSRVGHLRCQN